MAQIIENMDGRNLIRLSTDDILSIVREYQNITYGLSCYKSIRGKLEDVILYLPDETYNL